MPGRRSHERYEISLSVVILHNGQEHQATTGNVSLGGMYLLTDAKLRYGEQVEVRFRLPALNEDTTCGATVRWKTPDGLGVQFGSLRALEAWGLNQLFRSAVAQPESA